MPTLSTAELTMTTGGFQWEHWRHSYNVEDRRRDAPPVWKQKLNTFKHNWKNGYWY